MKGHRQPKNLKQILTKAKCEEEAMYMPTKISRCGRSNCGICNIMIERDSFKFKNGDHF